MIEKNSGVNAEVDLESILESILDPGYSDEDLTFDGSKSKLIQLQGSLGNPEAGIQSDVGEGTVWSIDWLLSINLKITKRCINALNTIQ